MSTRAWVLAGLAAVLVVGSACTTKAAPDEAAATTSTSTSTSTSAPASDDSSTTSAATNELSGAGANGPAGQNDKTAFVEQGNSICTVMNDRSDALSAPISEEDATPQQVASGLEQIAQVTRDAVAGLRALPQPAGDEATLAAMYADVDLLASYADQLVAAIRAQNQQAVDALERPMLELTENTNAEFIAYGLTVCGR